MAKLNLAHGGWLLAVMDSLHLPTGHARPDDMPCCEGGMARPYNEVHCLPGMFARARLALGEARPNGVEALDSERRTRVAELQSLSLGLSRCREALTECRQSLALGAWMRLDDALRTLETEYVRLCDADRFHYLRRVRQAQTAETDSDPEFTAVLERVLYAADTGDEVAASVSQAVQAIDAVLAQRGAREQTRAPSAWPERHLHEPK